MAKVDLRKTVLNKDQFNKVVGGRDFTTFTLNGEATLFSVEDFFTQYENLFLTIPIFGEVNTHEYLVRKSSELVGFQRTTEDIQPLLDEISNLRDQLLQSRQENINLQIESAGGGIASELNDQFNDLLAALGSQPEISVNIDLPGSGEDGTGGASGFTLIEDTIRTSISATGIPQSAEVSVFENDTIEEGKTLTFIGIDRQPQFGTAVVTNTQNGTIKYTPNPDAPTGERIDQITYKVRDEQGVENTGFISINIENIKQVNKPPVANDDLIIATVDVDGKVNPATLNILANDVDPDSNEPLFFDKIISTPKYGTLTVLDPEVGIVEYKPNKRAPNGEHVDMFEYRILDTKGASAIGKVHINIRNKYITFASAGDDSLGISIRVTDTQDPNRSYTVEDNVINVLDNDAGLELVFNGIVTPPQYGSVVSDSNGVITYTPKIGTRSSGEIDLNAFFTPGAGVEPVAEDSFIYRITNLASGAVDTATVTVRINAINPDAQPRLDDDPTIDPAANPNTNKDTDSTGRPIEPDPTNDQDPRNQPADNTNKTSNTQVTLRTF